MHKKNQVSLLERYGIREDETYNILRPYNLISPTYSFSDRGGYWFCPNAKIRELAYTKQYHPELWDELVVFENTENKVSQNFKNGKTFKQINAEVDAYIANPPGVQLSQFDLLKMLFTRPILPNEARAILSKKAPNSVLYPTVYSAPLNIFSTSDSPLLYSTPHFHYTVKKR